MMWMVVLAGYWTVLEWRTWVVDQIACLAALLGKWFLKSHYIHLGVQSLNWQATLVIVWWCYGIKLHLLEVSTILHMNSSWDLFYTGSRTYFCTEMYSFYLILPLFNYSYLVFLIAYKSCLLIFPPPVIAHVPIGWVTALGQWSQK